MSVDFPMPGSPPMSTTEPGTIPPPSTRSNSPNPDGARFVLSGNIWFSGWGTERSVPGTAEGFDLTVLSSASVFHCPQSGHLPIHLGVVCPHA